MSLFKKFEITEKDNSKINSLLPEYLKKEVWYVNDFSDDHLGNKSLYNKHMEYCDSLKKQISNKKYSLEDLKNTFNSKLSEKIIIYNTEIVDANPLGMVDLGVIAKFGATSTGNRFENGFIGYAIENAIYKVWSESNIQYEELQKAKIALLKKTKDIYPSCNLLFKFEVDFREIGSSGNVFLYLRGTACKGKNEILDKTENLLNSQISKLELEIPKKQTELAEMESYLSKIPRSKASLKKILGK